MRWPYRKGVRFTDGKTEDSSGPLGQISSTLVCAHMHKLCISPASWCDTIWNTRHHLQRILIMKQNCTSPDNAGNNENLQARGNNTKCGSLSQSSQVHSMKSQRRRISSVDYFRTLRHIKRKRQFLFFSIMIQQINLKINYVKTGREVWYRPSTRKHWGVTVKSRVGYRAAVLWDGQ